MNFGSTKVESHFHNLYSIDIYGMLSSSHSCVPSQTQSLESNNYAHNKPIMQNLYGWHINKYMQKYQGDTSFHNYFSHFTFQNQNEEEIDDFQPFRSSIWY